jgi:hypothetical protein
MPQSLSKGHEKVYLCLLSWQQEFEYINEHQKKGCDKAMDFEGNLLN